METFTDVALRVYLQSKDEYIALGFDPIQAIMGGGQVILRELGCDDKTIESVLITLTKRIQKEQNGVAEDSQKI